MIRNEQKKIPSFYIENRKGFIERNLKTFLSLSLAIFITYRVREFILMVKPSWIIDACSWWAFISAVFL